jgi:hypothetical protein
MKSRIKLITTISLILVISAVLFGVCTASAQPGIRVQAGGASKDRLVVKKSDFNPPVRISMVKTRKGKVETDKPYQDSDDSVRGLTVSISNASGKGITYIDVAMLFRRTDNREPGPPAVWHLEYGDSPFLQPAGESIAPVKVIPILPKETFELEMSDHHFGELQTFLRMANFPPSLNIMELRVMGLGFSDGTAWSGRMVRRDSDSPAGWSPIDSPTPDSFKLRSRR